MLFNSFEFLLFFPVVTLIYFILPHRVRWLWLLVASCFFYMFFKPEYILILGFTIVVDYWAGILIENAQGATRKWYLVMSLVANIGVLAVFKYYNFINDNVTGLLSLFHKGNSIPALRMLLPIGLSFHTFQAMSYTLEVYRGNQKAERHFGIYSLYVMFYPQLVAGPIERPQNLLHQFHERRPFNEVDLLIGCRMIMWGIFKKTVIADRLTLFVDPVYDHPAGYTTASIVVASIFFAFQIYCDFSGYSNIALGTARVMGIDLMVNFNKPFRSRSITEFWRRWHISLSRWFNDYFFLPVASGLGNTGNWAIPVSLVLTFLVSGLWHGAGWKFVIFGFLHGLAVTWEFLTRKKRKKIIARLPDWLAYSLGVSVTFAYAVFAWIFFRARTTADAFYIVRRLFLKGGPKADTHLNHLDVPLMLTGFALIGLLETIHRIEKDERIELLISKLPSFGRWALFFAGFMSIYFAGVFGSKQFIYFQF